MKCTSAVANTTHYFNMEFAIGLLLAVNVTKASLPMEDSAVLVFLSLSLMSWRSASRSLSSDLSSLDAAQSDRVQQRQLIIDE